MRIPGLDKLIPSPEREHERCRALEIITDLVSREFDVTPEQLKRKEKRFRTAGARQIAIWVARRGCGFNLDDIGSFYSIHKTRVHQSIKIVDQHRWARMEVQRITDSILARALERLAASGIVLQGVAPEPKRPTRQAWEAEADRRAQELDRLDPPVTLTREDVFRRR